MSFLLLDSLEISEALGRSLIFEKDRSLSENPLVLGVSHINYDSINWIICNDRAVKIAFNLTPKEALEYIKYKAVTIAGIEHDQILFDIKRKIQSALKNGVKLSEFQSQIDDLLSSYGVDKLHPRHTQTVFRTNIYTAFSLGELAQAKEMSDRFPLWRYSAINDSATRPEHLKLNGQVFEVGRGPIPPIDYNCRCTAIYLHVTQSQGITPKKTGFDEKSTKFDNKKAFELWKESKLKTVTKSVQDWINANLETDFLAV